MQNSKFLFPVYCFSAILLFSKLPLRFTKLSSKLSITPTFIYQKTTKYVHTFVLLTAQMSQVLTAQDNSLCEAVAVHRQTDEAAQTSSILIINNTAPDL